MRYVIKDVVVALLGLSAVFASSNCRAGSASALTQVYVYAVRSTGSPDWEYFSPGAVATQRDHQGSILQVAVVEIGYSSWRVAQFNGASMRLVQSIPIYDPSYLVYGYVRVFEYTGVFTDGSFTFQAQSMVAPIRTLSTRFYIR